MSDTRTVKKPGYRKQSLAKRIANPKYIMVYALSLIHISEPTRPY